MNNNGGNMSVVSRKIKADNLLLAHITVSEAGAVVKAGWEQKPKMFKNEDSAVRWIRNMALPRPKHRIERLGIIEYRTGELTFMTATIHPEGWLVWVVHTGEKFMARFDSLEKIATSVHKEIEIKKGA